MSETHQRSLEALASLKLTPREAEVLFWISEGKSNQDIGVILGASTGTNCKHVEHILSKLNVENRTAAAVIALETSFSLAQQLSELWTDGCEIYNAITALIA
jgi:DNA-binding NarL/FixJ family response regulator